MFCDCMMLRCQIEDRLVGLKTTLSLFKWWFSQPWMFHWLMLDVIVDLLASRAKYHNFFPFLHVFFCFNRKFYLEICIADMPETTWSKVVAFLVSQIYFTIGWVKIRGLQVVGSVRSSLDKEDVVSEVSSIWKLLTTGLFGMDNSSVNLYFGCIRLDTEWEWTGETGGLEKSCDNLLEFQGTHVKCHQHLNLPTLGIC